MSLPTTIALALASLAALTIAAADVTVQLNVNHPLNDVDEKFVSFAVDPEDLYKALDGPYRKTMTRMSTMLGDSYVKFVGDYYFGTKTESKIRNPTTIIWKGFNRWTRAVNWTMIIPVPYSPAEWDPMYALTILNDSHLIDISDCIWQLGTDFASSRAKDYVTELNTLNLMVDSFRPHVEDWQVMGADISAGSSAEETRRYIELSKHLNAAYGWTQTSDSMAATDANNFIDQHDPALKMLFSKNVPVWLSLPQINRVKKSGGKFLSDDHAEAFRWAQTLGDAANIGFDAVFRKLSLYDLERPTFTFYVTALFKKVMGSRVFPARPLKVFARGNKLYTHCASAASGGLAFMMVNPDEKPITVSVRSLAKFADNEVWQYTLTSNKGAILLNDANVTVNSTLKPQIKMGSDKHVQLVAPGMSVSFWVLPNAELEHCQFTEIEAKEAAKDNENTEEIEYSSSDRLLKKLIQETSLTHSPIARVINRRRRYATNRPKRFVLEGDKSQTHPGIGKLFSPFEFVASPLSKRENGVQETGMNALKWIGSLLDTPLLKRRARSTDDFFGPFFANKDGKRTTFTKKITEIKKPEKKTKPIFNLDEFDEEKFFKKIEEYTEPEYTRLPEGDVFLKHITNTDGEDIEDLKEEQRQQKSAKLPENHAGQTKEVVNEMKPLRLLPTEFYESLPINAFKPASSKMGFGEALNTLLFPEPFSKQTPKKTTKTKSKLFEATTPSTTTEAEPEELGPSKLHRGGQLAQEFLRAQKELSKAFLNLKEYQEKEQNNDSEREEEATIVEDVPGIEHESSHEAKAKAEQLPQRKYEDYLAESFGNFFGEKTNERDEDQKTKRQSEITKKKHLPLKPWWEISALRQKRALRLPLSDDAVRTNLITKDEELTPLGDTDTDMLLGYNSARYEYQVPAPQKRNTNNVVRPLEDQNIPEKIVNTVKENVTKFVDIVARHVHEWYNTLAKQIESAVIEE